MANNLIENRIAKAHRIVDHAWTYVTPERLKEFTDEQWRESAAQIDETMSVDTIAMVRTVVDGRTTDPFKGLN